MSPNPDSPELDEFRREVREFLDGEWDPDRYPAEAGNFAAAAGTPLGAWHAKLQEARLTAPHWPSRYGGRGLTLFHKRVVTEELVRAGAPAPSNVIGIGWAGPAILAHGTPEQKQRFLEPMLAGREHWCQLFSEPGAGSDLAGLNTRAVRDGDEFVVTGQKIWTSGADDSDWGILLARTDPQARKHDGITYFLLDMHSPGVEVRPIRQMTGEREFCEVFLEEVRVPAEMVVGEVGGGWRVAVTTLANERISLSTGLGMLWGLGPPFADFWRWAASRRVSDPLLRDRLAEAFIERTVIDCLEERALAAAGSGGGAGGSAVGVEAAIQKLVSDRFAQKAMNLAMDVMGADGLLWEEALEGEERRFVNGFLFSRALTIGGGTEEVQKNILGERALGLPGEPRTDKEPAALRPTAV